MRVSQRNVDGNKLLRGPVGMGVIFFPVLRRLRLCFVVSLSLFITRVGPAQFTASL